MRTPRVVIGAPVHERAWVLDAWFRHLLPQVEPERTHFVFAFGPGRDETLDILQSYWDDYDWAGFDILCCPGPNVAVRSWNVERYTFMAELRNKLLRQVREIQPAYYLSLDTDILLPPTALQTLVEEMRVGVYDGIAPLTYMTPTGVLAPNAMTYGWATRPAIGVTTMRVDACFGAVLMGPELYQTVDYATHTSGEDLGWAERARRRGMRLALCPQVKAKHVMTPDMLTLTDERVGF